MPDGAATCASKSTASTGSAIALAAYNSGPERGSLKAGYIPAVKTQHYVRTATTNWARLALSAVRSW